MQRKFLINLILIIFVNLLIKPFYLFGIDRSIQNTVGSADYGLYYALFNLSFIFSIIIDPGITNYNVRHISRHNHLLTKYFNNISVIKIYLSLVYILILGVWALFMGQYDTKESMLLGILCASQIFNSYILYNRSNISGLQLFKTDTFISILDKLLMIVFCGAFLILPTLQNKLDISTFAWIQLLSMFITAVISYAMVKTYTSQRIQFKIKRTFFFMLLKESYPYALLALLMMVYMKADTVLLKFIHPEGNKEVGNYAAAYRLIDALNMIAVLFSGILYPIFSKLIKDKESPESLVKTAFSILVVPACIISLLSGYYSKEIMAILYTEDPLYVAEIFSILIIAFIFICNTYVFGTLLTANGNIRLLNKIALTSVIINIILNIIFIPQYGAIGSAFISILTYGITSIAHGWYSYKKFGISISFSYIMRAGLSILMISGIFYLTSSINANWISKLTLNLAGSVIILWICRLLPFRELIKILKAK